MLFTMYTMYTMYTMFIYHDGRVPYGEDMTKIIAQVRQRGNSLVLVVTRVCAVMGIKNGDWVSIDMKKAKIIEKEDEEGKE